MPEVKFVRGNNTDISDFPLDDGQILVGLQNENTAAIYVDAIVNDTLIRFPLGYCDSSYISRINKLEDQIFTANTLSRPVWSDIGCDDVIVSQEQLFGFIDESTNEFTLIGLDDEYGNISLLDISN